MFQVKLQQHPSTPAAREGRTATNTPASEPAWAVAATPVGRTQTDALICGSVTLPHILIRSSGSGDVPNAIIMRWLQEESGLLTQMLALMPPLHRRRPVPQGRQ